MGNDGWTVSTFARLIEAGILEIGDGYRAQNAELGEDGPIFLRAGHVTDTHIDFTGVERFRAELADRVRPKMSRPGDVIITTKGNSTGRVSRVAPTMPPFVYSPHLSYWRSLDPRRLSPGFLRYWSRSREFRDQLLGLKGSTDMAPYLSLADQKRLRITLPPSERQQEISRILGSLDDKIDLNRRMNETLEAIARALFRSWFVDFDPVRAKLEGRQPAGMDAETAALFPDSFEDSPLGKTPRGWRAGHLGDVAVNQRRGAAVGEIEPNTPYIGLEHMPRRSIALAEWGDSDGLESNKFQFAEGDILFGKLRPYFHKVGVAATGGVCSTDILVIAPKQSKWFAFTLGHASSDEFIRYTDAGSSGTKMPRTNWADMARYEIVIPHDSVAAEFTKIVRPLVEAIRSHILQNQTLAALRDALLPNLLSGEIRVGGSGGLPA